MKLDSKLSKSDNVREFIRKGLYKEALVLASGFRMKMAAQEVANIQRASECIRNPEFYKSLGKDAAALIEQGVVSLKKIFGEGSDYFQKQPSNFKKRHKHI